MTTLTMDDFESSSVYYLIVMDLRRLCVNQRDQTGSNVLFTTIIIIVIIMVILVTI